MCSGCRLLVFRFGLTAHSPSFLISCQMRRRPTKTPSRMEAIKLPEDGDAAVHSRRAYFETRALLSMSYLIYGIKKSYSALEGYEAAVSKDALR